MAMRSNNGPEIRFWYLVTTAGAHPQALCGALSHPHGPGFIAVIHRRFAEKLIQRTSSFVTHWAEHQILSLCVTQMTRPILQRGSGKIGLAKIRSRLLHYCLHIESI